MEIIVGIGVLVVIYYFISARKEKKPAAMLNRALGSGKEPSEAIKRFDRAEAIEWANDVIKNADKVAIIDTEDRKDNNPLWGGISNLVTASEGKKRFARTIN